jgi:ACS family hexuronate transporter-like MFS transporter
LIESRTALRAPANTTAEVARSGRWWICGLLFFATTINYIDRQVLGILKPMLEKQFGWSESDYGWITFGFQLGYALMMPIAGRLIDALGTRLGYALAVIAWSLAAMAHGLARTVPHFIAARLALGLSEAANFPAAVRTVADWFPRQERSLATGIFNSGSNVGLVLAAGAPFIATRYGWQAAFFLTGALGLIWVLPWLLGVRVAASVSAGTIAAATQPATPYRELLGARAAWAVMAGKFITDPVWWFFIFWIPSFLNRTYQVDLLSLGPPLLVIYLAADVGSIGGGWIFKLLSARGWTPTRARKTAMLTCAIAAVPVVTLLFVETLWLAVALVGLAAAAHQGWSVNLFTLTSDAFPKRSVASVVGMGGMAGAISGMLVSPIVGYWLDFSGGAYRPLFVIAGLAYLAAFAAIHFLLPDIDRAPESE